MEFRVFTRTGAALAFRQESTTDINSLLVARRVCSLLKPRVLGLTEKEGSLEEIAEGIVVRNSGTRDDSGVDEGERCKQKT